MSGKRDRLLTPGGQSHVVLATVAEIPSTVYEVATVLRIKHLSAKNTIEHLARMGFLERKRYERDGDECVIYIYRASAKGRQMLRAMAERFGEQGSPAPTVMQRLRKGPRARCVAKYSTLGTGCFSLAHSVSHNYHD